MKSVERHATRPQAKALTAVFLNGPLTRAGLRSPPNVSICAQRTMTKPPPTFASLEGLLDHGQRDGFDIRPTLLRVLTDLYLQKPTHPLDDERYYTELALRLINSTDVPA